MRTALWFRCPTRDRSDPDADPIAALRSVMRRLYYGADLENYGLVVIRMAPEVTGFGRVSARLGYVRLLHSASDGREVAITSDGRVMGVLCGDIDLPDRLAVFRDRLAEATPGGWPPLLEWHRLPECLPDALRLLDEMAQ